MAGSKNFVIYYREMIVSHEYGIGSMFTVVTVGKITVTFHIHVAITGNE